MLAAQLEDIVLAMESARGSSSIRAEDSALSYGVAADGLDVRAELEESANLL